MTVTMTPLEVTGGWRFHGLLGQRFTPYVGGGYTSMRYEETSEFAGTDDDLSDRFGNGFHLTGGADVRLGRWIAVGGDVTWTSIADAIGTSGASAVFEEDNLGGTSLRVRMILAADRFARRVLAVVTRIPPGGSAPTARSRRWPARPARPARRATSWPWPGSRECPTTG